MYQVEYSPAAVRHLRSLRAADRAWVIDAVDSRLVHEPEAASRNRKKLRENPIADWALRVGHLRIYYEVKDESVLIIAIGVKNRETVYVEGEPFEI